MPTTRAHVAVASPNQTVGDWSGNAGRIAEVVGAARDRGARLLVLPEMCVSGYSLGDRLLRAGTLERSWDRMLGLAEHTRGIAVTVGLPIRHEGVIYNGMALLANGELAGLVAKENLATGDVEYENRYFLPWPTGRLVEYRGPDGTTAPFGTQIFELPGLGKVAFEICEDAWKGIRPGSIAALAGAEVLVNPSASWFTIGKHETRRRIVREISREDHCVYLYTSLLGCDATRLIFDGSLFVAVNGRIEAEGRRFVFTRDWELLDRVVDLTELRQARMEEGSWRDQLGRIHAGVIAQPPAITRVAGDFSTERTAAPPSPYWQPPPPSHPDPSLEYFEQAVFAGKSIEIGDLWYLELELALAIGLRDYVRKSGIGNVCLALSGGRDSAMVALLVERMYRYGHPDLGAAELRAMIRRHFTCVYMATANSGEGTRRAARAVADEIGATYIEGSIESALAAAESTVGELTGRVMSWANAGDDIPLQNIQARLRGMLIWTIANLNRSLLLVTSNKSEAAVGYTTMDGDSSGGLAPIADVPKSLVRSYLAWAIHFHGLKGFELVDRMEPTAELRPADRSQTDEDDLMPFSILDQLMHAFVQLGLDPVGMFERLWPAMREHYGGDAARFGADIKKFVRLFCFAQWKRERFAISFRVTAFDLDPKTGFRFPPVQAPFTEELAELDARVQGMTGG
jgi:NAD+ synthase (glutamine-hydrolysing)